MGMLDRRSFDTAASGQAQANIAATAGQLEALISARDAQVKQAMADFAADGVSEEYHGKEVQWNRAASEVRQIIALVKTSLQRRPSRRSPASADAVLSVRLLWRGRPSSAAPQQACLPCRDAAERRSWRCRSGTSNPPGYAQCSGEFRVTPKS
jgi:hypothetical protein